ncbi:Histidine kinase CKI1 [Morella rubra]|uniref:histidine kinase n=1 Tax=Morella rubra TaxID=262757 RepID=A0A6A1USZ5_9ROSI|nr:Histidine kinase CKI1 [Morella rubra]
MNSAQEDPDALEYVFEVDDTGKGIPKEKQKLVFENYVQFKEIALRQGGIGLGLGIVQSLVRLMHGDIGFRDKEIGEQGTYFRFIVLLGICRNVSYEDAKAEDLEMAGDTNQSLGLTSHNASLEITIQSPSPGMCIRTESPKLMIHTPSPKKNASRVVLLIQDMNVRGCQKSLGVKVSVVKQWEHLPSTLEKIKLERNHSHHNSAISDISSPSDYLSRYASDNSITVEKEVPLSIMDGSDDMQSMFRRITPRWESSFVLIVIDASTGPFPVLCKIVAEFRRGPRNICCKVVWLEKPTMQSIIVKDIEEDLIDSNDIFISKPFHDSCLYTVVKTSSRVWRYSARQYKPMEERGKFRC